MHTVSFTTSTTDLFHFSNSQKKVRKLVGSHQMRIWLAAALCILWPSLAKMKGKNPSLAHTTLPPSHEVLPWANSVLSTRITPRENEKECVWEWDREGGASKLCPGWVRGGGGWECRRSNSLTFLGNRTKGKSEQLLQDKEVQREEWGGEEWKNNKDALKEHSGQERSGGICSCARQEDMKRKWADRLREEQNSREVIKSQACQ